MRLVPLSLLTVSVAASPGIVSADPIRIIADHRIATALVRVQPNVGDIIRDSQILDVPSDHLAAEANISRQGYVASAGAELSSTIAPTRFSGTGAVSARATASPTNQRGEAVGGGDVSFGVTFQLDTAHMFDLNSLFTGSESHVPGPLFEGGVAWSINVIGINSGTVFGATPGLLNGFVGTEPVHATRLLQPDQYFFSVTQSAAEHSTQPNLTRTSAGNFSFTFDLTPAAPTPEPGSIALLGSGLVGLVAIARRKRCRLPPVS
jgi:hypothetical protein